MGCSYGFMSMMRLELLSLSSSTAHLAVAIIVAAGDQSLTGLHRCVTQLQRPKVFDCHHEHDPHAHLMTFCRPCLTSKRWGQLCHANRLARGYHSGAETQGTRPTF